jgi:hypothetical protein
MSLKNIYIYDATPEDAIKFCGREIKVKGKDVPSKEMIIEGIRIQFMDDFAYAAHFGMDQRLDIAVINMPDYRGGNTSLDLKYLGLAGTYPVEIL